MAIDYSVGSIIKQGKELTKVSINHKMTNAEYDSIRTTMNALGGHWNEAYKAFIFANNPREALSKVTSLLAPTDLPESAQWQLATQFYPTPPEIAELMTKQLHMQRFDHILEPSAGTGGLLKFIPLGTGRTLVEPCEVNAMKLMENNYDVRFCTIEKYLADPTNWGTYNKVIMNPPFSGQRDALHTMLVYRHMAPGGILAGIVSENTLYYKTDTTKKFRTFLSRTDAKVTELPYGSFYSSGTMVDTMMVVINKQLNSTSN